MSGLIRSGSALAKLNARLVADAMKKIKAGTAVIVCQGDSMTYGHDAFSADVIAPVPPHVQSRVPVPYPEKLVAALNTAYGVAGLTVVNRGFSGDTAKGGFTRWTTNPGGDLAFIMYGINDAASPGGATLEEFARYLALTVERYNAWGCGVVVVTPTLMSQGSESRNVAPYRAATIEVARKYACPVFRADTVGLNNIKESIYSDSVHFNTAGYGLLGNAAAMFVIGGGLAETPNTITAEKTLLLGSESHLATNGSLIHGAGAYARQGLIVQLIKGTGHRATLAFYLDADAAEVSLLGLVSKGSDIEFDMDSIRADSTRKALTAATSDNYNVASNDVRLEPGNSLTLGRVIGRGWHSIAVTAPDADSTQNAYLSAITITPKRQIECIESVTQVVPRAFSVFDPPVSFGPLPPASSVTEFVLPAALFGALMVAKTDYAYYQSAFAIVTLRGVGPAVTYSRYMITANSATTYAATLLESVGATAPTIVSVTGPVEDTTTGSMTITLNRPEANYIEMRFEVVDGFDLKTAELV